MTVNVKSVMTSSVVPITCPIGWICPLTAHHSIPIHIHHPMLFLHSNAWCPLVLDSTQIRDNSCCKYSRYRVLVLIRTEWICWFRISSPFYTIPSLFDSSLFNSIAARQSLSSLRSAAKCPRAIYSEIRLRAVFEVVVPRLLGDDVLCIFVDSA